MPISRVVTGLLKKRAQLQASLEYHTRHAAQHEAAECQKAIDHVNAVLALYDEARTAPQVRAQHFVNPKLHPHGVISRLVTDVLREAAGPMTVGQICEVLIQGHGLVMVDPRSTRRLNQQVSTAITEKRERGLVRAAGKLGRWPMWELIQLQDCTFSVVSGYELVLANQAAL